MKKLFFTKMIAFPKLRYKTVQSFNLVLMHNYAKLWTLIFCSLTLSFFSAVLLSLPVAFHILYGCRKKLGVNFGQSLEMINYRNSGSFYHRFCTKTDNLFQIAMPELCRMKCERLTFFSCILLETKEWGLFTRVFTLQKNAYRVHLNL